jgi:hypothetical protein
VAYAYPGLYVNGLTQRGELATTAELTVTALEGGMVFETAAASTPLPDGLVPEQSTADTTRFDAGNLILFATPGKYRLTGSLNGLAIDPLDIVVPPDPRDLVDEGEAAAFQTQGGRVRVGSLALPDLTADPNSYVKFQAYHDADTGMVIWTQKTGGDSTNVNVDGSVIVKHGKNYASTPGYADTVQVYTLAGSDGTIVGNNNFVGVTTPYAPTVSAVPNGYVRFELGPLWPYSEKMRLNNQGDLIVGWSLVRKTTCSQSGTTITGTGADFQPSDVGKFLAWGDYETGGKRAFVDRITGYTGPGQVTVETSRTIANQAARVVTPKAIVTKDGEVRSYAAPTLFTPALRGSTTNPSLGSGALQFGRYYDDGTRIHGDVKIRLGSGFTAGAGVYSISLPLAAHADDVAENLLAGVASYYDLSSGITYNMACAVFTTDSILFYIDGTSQALSATSPAVPAAGDEYRVQFSYRRAT